MKKGLFILAAASAVAFAACNGNNEGSYSQQQVDSIANWKADSATNAAKAANDSMINAQANAEARAADSMRVIDSIVAATKKSSTTTVVKKTSGGKTTTTTKTETVVEQPVKQAPATVGNGKPKMGEGTNTTKDGQKEETVGNGKPKF